ncbi:MAG: hypothetical protein K8J08_17285, partial [Thermoanaerobaculia bacterium]|nr:hypothetical protein [Thermoanaerobaculia bacterium]
EPPFPVVAPTEARATVDALFDEASRLRSEIDRTSFDLDAVLARTGTNLESVFRWVRTNTYPLPYRGVLKGAQGTLMDRGGSSLDRSLLLAELLQRAGHNVRLVNAQLSPKGRAIIDAQVLERLSQWSSSPRTEPEESGGLAVEVQRLAALSGQDPVQAVAYARELEKRGKAVRQEVLEQADHQTEALIQTVDLEKGGLSPLEAALPALQDHWWVEVLDPPEVALDLYFDQREEGIEAQGLGATPKSHAIEAIPETLFHTVTISVVAEQSSGERVRSRPALEETFRVADLGLRPLELSFVPSWKEGSVEELLNLESGDDSAVAPWKDRFDEALNRETGWTPALRIGEEVHIESTIAPDGSVGPAQALYGTGQALGSALSRLEALGDAGSDPSGSGLVQVATKVTLQGPDGGTSHTRTLFDERDRDGESQQPMDRRQRNARFLSTQSFVIQTGEVSLAFLADAEFEAILGMQKPLRQLITSAQDGNRAEVLKTMLSLRPPVDPAQQLAGLRWGGLVSKGNSVVVSANVLSSFRAVSLEGSVSRVVSGLDILENQVLPVAASADDARRANVYRGVLDTLLEDAVLGFVPERTNTAHFMGRDGASSEKGRSTWRMASASVGAELYPGAAHRLADSEDGEPLRIVYSPSRRASGAANAPFWLVDTRTGATLGLDSEGRGSAFTEFLVLLNNMWTLANGFAVAAKCAEADATGGYCEFQSCLYSATTLTIGVYGSGFLAFGLGVGAGAVAAGGLLYKFKTAVVGAVVSDICESS